MDGDGDVDDILSGEGTGGGDGDGLRMEKGERTRYLLEKERVEFEIRNMRFYICT